MTEADIPLRAQVAQIVKACCGCGLDIACSVHDPLVERVADRLLAAFDISPRSGGVPQPANEEQ